MPLAAPVTTTVLPANPVSIIPHLQELIHEI
jgi:hypothetical protein